MNDTTTRRLAAATMFGAAACATIGFSGLGSAFDYPAILERPTAEILATYRLHQSAITAWFACLVVGAALLAPIAVLLSRLVTDPRRRRWTAGLGIAAAVVQVVGLSRWLWLVPGASHDALDPARAADAVHRFEVGHAWLGHALGETIGYALTAAFTVTAVLGLTMLPRWSRITGLVAAALVATGVLVPLGVDVAELTNFVGYLLWTAWIVAVAIVLVRRPHAARASAVALTA